MVDQSQLIARNPPWKLGETQNAITGYVGLAVIMACAALVLYLQQFDSLKDTLLWDLRKVIGVIVIFLAMALVELLVFKVHRRNFDFATSKLIDGAAKLRILQREVALFLALCIVGLVFLIAEISFPKFFVFYIVFAPLILLIAPGYFLLVEKFGKEDSFKEDDLLIFGQGLFNRDLEKEHVLNLFRGAVVKGFFIPFMVMSCITFWNFWELDAAKAMLHNPFVATEQSALAWSAFFKAAIDLIVLVDVTIATLGYLTSSRLLDTQFSSVEPTLIGWLVAVACYPPFNFIFRENAWKYAEYELTDQIYAVHPVLSLVLAVAIVILMSIYCWSTVVFGLRFSNLTNRGIIFSGPYRFVRHPAYISKNLSWWIALISFMSLQSQIMWLAIAVLVVINITYYLRAVTEEKHLMREVHYQEYCRLVKWRFIPGLY